MRKPPCFLSTLARSETCHFHSHRTVEKGCVAVWATGAGRHLAATPCSVEKW